MNILYSQSYLSLNYKVVFSILFILNPTVASLLILFFLSSKSCRVNHVFLGIILSAYVSLINITKVPVNDLESYLEYFSAAGDMPLYEYLFYWNKYKAGVESLKEPGYAVFSYISYHILGGNQKAFVFFFSFLIYNLYFVSLAKVCKCLNLNNRQVVVSILFLFFNPVFFSLSVHLFRQILAGAILFYILVGCFFYGKIKYLLILMLPLIHSTTFLFIPMMFLFRFMHPYMNKKSIINMLLLVLILSNYQLIASLLLTFVSGKIIFLDYILSRASEDTSYELGKLPIHQIGILLFIIIAIIMFNLKRMKYNDELYKFYNVFVFLSIFILLNLRQEELSNRFYVFIWLFLPYFVIPFSRNISLTMLKCFIVIIWIVFFIYINITPFYIYKAAPYLLSDSVFGYLLF